MENQTYGKTTLTLNPDQQAGGSVFATTPSLQSISAGQAGLQGEYAAGAMGENLLTEQEKDEFPKRHESTFLKINSQL